MVLNPGFSDSRIYLLYDNHNAKAERQSKHHLVQSILFTDEEISQERLHAPH